MKVKGVKGRFAIFNDEYVGRAKPKQLGESLTTAEKLALEEEVKYCKSCGEPFEKNDFIHICKNNSPKRRHVECAVEKHILDQKEADMGVRKLMAIVTEDMKREIPAAIKTLDYLR